MSVMTIRRQNHAGYPELENKAESKHIKDSVRECIKLIENSVRGLEESYEAGG